MKLLPVHCCCKPAIRLGYVEVPDGTDRGSIRFTIPPAFHLQAPGPDSGRPRMNPSSYILTEVATLGYGDGTGATLAVKSAHLDVETWRRVPGFREFLAE